MENSHIEKIKTLVEQEYGYSVDDKTRKRQVVEARAMFYYILKNFSNLTLAAIARTVNKNHATVLHGLRNFEVWREQNKYLEFAFKNIVYKLDALDEIENYVDVMELRRELLKAKMDLLALQNKKDKVGALYELLKDLPAEKVKDLEDKIKLTIKSYSWKYKDKGKIYQTYA
jgi:hypothetical protein